MSKLNVKQYIRSQIFSWCSPDLLAPSFVKICAWTPLSWTATQTPPNRIQGYHKSARNPHSDISKLKTEKGEIQKEYKIVLRENKD